MDTITKAIAAHKESVEAERSTLVFANQRQLQSVALISQTRIERHLSAVVELEQAADKIDRLKAKKARIDAEIEAIERTMTKLHAATGSAS